MRFLTAVAANLIGTLIAVGGLFVILLILLGALIAGSGAGVAPVKSDSVLIVDISRAIPEIVSNDALAQSFGGEMHYGLYDFTRAIANAGNDQRIKAVWLRTGEISSPWADLQSIRRALEEFKESGKPIVASSRSFTFPEKALYLASVADSVFADPNALFEMNGFAVTVTFYKNLLDKLNIRAEAIRAGSYKGAVEPFFREDLSDDNREQLAAIVDDIASVFVADVAASRGMEPATLYDQMASGSILTTRDAQNAGLIDGLRYESDVRKSIARLTNLDTTGRFATVSMTSYVQDQLASRKMGSDEVAVVYAVGDIMPGQSSEIPNPLSGGASVGSETFARSMQRARRSSRTKAIIVRINSPGGVAPAADAMLKEIRDASSEVPVVISMGDVAASGGYWMAMGSQTLVAEPLTLTGSIGVFSLILDTSGFLDEKLGITLDGVKSSPHADMFSGVRSFSDEERQQMQRTTDQTYDAFLSLVADARHLSVKEVDGLAQGRVWTGRAAKEIGLVDELGGMDRAIELATEQASINLDQMGIRVYSAPRGFLERFSQPIESVFAGALSAFGNGSETSRILAARNHLMELLQSSGSVMARTPYRIEAR